MEDHVSWSDCSDEREREGCCESWPAQPVSPPALRYCSLTEAERDSGRSCLLSGQLVHIAHIAGNIPLLNSVFSLESNYSLLTFFTLLYFDRDLYLSLNSIVRYTSQLLSHTCGKQSLPRYLNIKEYSEREVRRVRIYCIVSLLIAGIPSPQC